MNLLLDTHAFIWFVEGSPELSSKAKNSILDVNNIKYVSIVSLWEMSIKLAQGKLDLNNSFDTVLNDIYDNGFQLYDINFSHILENTRLAWHHKDPFDRLLISQAIVDNLSVISKDENFPNYPISIVW
jgi:PIN domain nuclease of toxin-antitoxin system